MPHREDVTAPDRRCSSADAASTSACGLSLHERAERLVLRANPTEAQKGQVGGRQPPGVHEPAELDDRRVVDERAHAFGTVTVEATEGVLERGQVQRAQPW